MTETEIRSEMGRIGGLARSANMTKQERIESARRAAKARWAKRALAGKIAGSSADRRKARRRAVK